MSANYSDEGLSRFKQKHPLEFALILEIMNQFGDLAEDYYSTVGQPTDTTIVFDIGNDKNGKPTLRLTQNGMILLSAISSTITRNILSALNSEDALAKLGERAKKRVSDVTKQIFKCQNCGHDNKYSAAYCEKCGTKIQK